MASVLVDDGQPIPPSRTEGKAIGIDVGLTHFAITSDGSNVGESQAFCQTSAPPKAKTVKAIPQHPGQSKLAKVHAKVARCRKDFLHKLSRKIVNENQVIVTENLNVKGMVKNHNLTKTISDVGWGMFCTMLKYKAESEGKTYVEIDRWFPSSRLFHVCLNRIENLTLEVRAWTCLHFGTHHDRDLSAAINIRNEGLRILSLGTRDTACGGSVSRRGKTEVLLDAIPFESESPHSIA